MERQRDGNAGEEERGRGRNGSRETRRTAARCSWCCWRGQRESKTREQGNHMYLTWNLYMAANGWERSRAIVEGGRNVRRSYTYTRTHAHTKAHTCTRAITANRRSVVIAPLYPRRPLKFAESVPQTREFPSKTSSIFFIDREISLQTRPSFRIPGFAHSFLYILFGKLKNFFFGENGKRVCLNSWIEIPSLSDRWYRNIEDTFQEAFKIYLWLNGSFDARLKKLGLDLLSKHDLLDPVARSGWKLAERSIRKNIRFDFFFFDFFFFLFFFTFREINGIKWNKMEFLRLIKIKSNLKSATRFQPWLKKKRKRKKRKGEIRSRESRARSYVIDYSTAARGDFNFARAKRKPRNGPRIFMN